MENLAKDNTGRNLARASTASISNRRITCSGSRLGYLAVRIPAILSQKEIAEGLETKQTSDEIPYSIKPRESEYGQEHWR